MSVRPFDYKDKQYMVMNWNKDSNVRQYHFFRNLTHEQIVKLKNNGYMVWIALAPMPFVKYANEEPGYCHYYPHNTVGYFIHFYEQLW